MIREDVGSGEIAGAMLRMGNVRFQPGAPVRFKSGILSPVYCDNRQFPFHPEAWQLVIAGFRALLRGDHIQADVIAGMEAAGIPHSAALGFAMGQPSVFVRKAAKEHGTKKRVEGGEVKGRRVVLVEDTVTTGGSSLQGVEALRAEGATVTDCLAIISYEFAEARESFAAAGVQLHTLTSFPEVLAMAERTGDLSAENAASVRAWLRSPKAWPGAGLGHGDQEGA